MPEFERERFTKNKKNFINKNCKTTKTKFINSLITNFIYNSRNI